MCWHWRSSSVQYHAPLQTRPLSTLQHSICRDEFHQGRGRGDFTCSALGNGSKGNKQDQQLWAGEVQQAGCAPPGEEEGRQHQHVYSQRHSK